MQQQEYTILYKLLAKFLFPYHHFPIVDYVNNGERPVNQEQLPCLLRLLNFIYLYLVMVITKIGFHLNTQVPFMLFP